MSYFSAARKALAEWKHDSQCDCTVVCVGPLHVCGVGSSSGKDRRGATRKDEITHSRLLMRTMMAHHKTIKKESSENRSEPSERAHMQHAVNVNGNGNIADQT